MSTVKCGSALARHEQRLVSLRFLYSLPFYLGSQMHIMNLIEIFTWSEWAHWAWCRSRQSCPPGWPGTSTGRCAPAAPEKSQNQPENKNLFKIKPLLIFYLLTCGLNLTNESFSGLTGPSPWRVRLTDTLGWVGLKTATLHFQHRQQ